MFAENRGALPSFHTSGGPGRSLTRRVPDGLREGKPGGVTEVRGSSQAWVSGRVGGAALVPTQEDHAVVGKATQV